MADPKLILLISGKRKSGKDFISEKLLQLLSKNQSEIIRISEPIKSTYAQSHNLNLDLLMGESAYKEKYRLDMITWSENIRNEDYGYFCKIACSNAKLKPVWIVSDIRRKTDLKWFEENYHNILKTVRITADIATRTERGWIFTDGIDDAESECNLDDISTWDFVFENNSIEHCEKIVNNMYKYCMNVIQ